MVKKQVEPEKTVTVKKKKGQYKQKECPYCGDLVGNLPNHIKMKHGDQAKAEGYQVEKPEMTKESLIAGKEPASANNTPLVPIYYCTNCKAKLRKGENPCWNCGQSLMWEVVE